MVLSMLMDVIFSSFYANYLSLFFAIPNIYLLLFLHYFLHPTPQKQYSTVESTL